MMNDLIWNEDEIVQEQARRQFLPFVEYMFPLQYDTQWFHKYICSEFDRFVKGEIKRLMVFLPPQHGKSTLMTEYLPAYILGKNPNEKIILVTYNAELSAKFNRKIQRVLEDDKYNLVFPETSLNHRNVVSDAKGSYVRNSSEFEIVGHQGSLRSTGVGGGIAGMPAYTALLDDVIKNVEEAYSETHRRKIYDWYTDELEARLHNHSKVAFTITRRHEDDLAGRLLDRDGTVEEGGKWHVIKLPALKEDNSNPNDIRQIGEALWENRHSRERMEEIRKNSSRTFSSLYQQRPAPEEGSIIKKDWFNWYNPNEVNFNKYFVHFYLDTAYTEKESNDPTAILAFFKKGNDIYLLNCETVRLGFPELVKFIPKFCKENGARRKSGIIIEPKASGISIVQYLRKETNLNIIQDKPPKDSKVARVNAIAPIIESGRVYLPENQKWVDPFISECASFPNGKHDDRVDCLVGALNRATKKRGGIRSGNMPVNY